MHYFDIDKAFKQITGDTNESFWTPAMKLAWANEAIQYAAKKTQAVEKRATIFSVASTREYDLPEDVISVQRVAYDGVVLQNTTQSNLSRENREWTTLTGTPHQFYLDMVNGKIGFYYVPSASTTLVSPSTFIVMTTGIGREVNVPTEDGILAVPDSVTPLSEDGIILDPLDATDFYDSEDGDLGRCIGGNDIEVFYVGSVSMTNLRPRTPKVLTSTILELPPWCHGLILFWMVARAYESETPLRNTNAAALFMHLAEKIISRLAVRSKGKLPKVWQQQAAYVYRDESPDVDSRFQYATET